MNGFARATENPIFFRDLILMEVSELNGRVRFIVRSVCNTLYAAFSRANLLSIFEFDAD